MTIVAIVYHSGYGHTAQLAKAVHRGAASVSGTTARLYTAEEGIAKIDELDGADAILFGTPTYMGGPAGAFKAFADASSKKWMKRAWKDKLAGGFTNSGSLSGDKQGTLLYLATLAMQHGMVWVGQGEMPGYGPGKTGDPESVNRLGSYIGAMSQSDQAPPEVAPPAGDLKTGELYGKRVAEAAARWTRGAR